MSYNFCRKRLKGFCRLSATKPLALRAQADPEKKGVNQMTLQEIENKIGASYHKSIIQQRVIDMWNTIGDNYEIVEVDWSPKRILIPDEIYNKLNKQTVALSLKDNTKHSVIITKVNISKQKKLYGNKYEYYYNNYMS